MVLTVYFDPFDELFVSKSTLNDELNIIVLACMDQMAACGEAPGD